MYFLYTRDIPTLEQTVEVTFSDDTAILRVDKSVEAVLEQLRFAFNKVRIAQKIMIKLNENEF